MMIWQINITLNFKNTKEKDNNMLNIYSFNQTEESNNFNKN